MQIVKSWKYDSLSNAHMSVKRYVITTTRRRRDVTHTADAYPNIDARSANVPRLKKVARRRRRARNHATWTKAWGGGKGGFGQSTLGEQVCTIAPECFAQPETPDNSSDRKVEASTHVSRVLQQFESRSDLRKISRRRCGGCA